MARQATYRRGGGLNRVCVWPSDCDGLAKVCLPCGCAETGYDGLEKIGIFYYCSVYMKSVCWRAEGWSLELIVRA